MPAPERPARTSPWFIGVGAMLVIAVVMVAVIWALYASLWG